MKISELEELLAREKDKHGDIETTMIGTLCPIGYSMGGATSPFKDVFESTMKVLKYEMMSCLVNICIFTGSVKRI